MPLLRRLAIAAFCSVGASGVLAAEPAPPLVVLDEAQIRAAVPAWADDSSLAGRADLETVLAQHALRTEELAA
jgi:hypothetical protein